MREANDQLASSKEQLVTLRKQLEEAQRLKDQAKKAKAEAKKAKAEAEKERDEAEQLGYDIGIAEIEDALKAEVPAVCRAYCAQTWEEALNRVGVEASSELRRLENVFFPQAIQASGLASNQKDVAPTADPAKEAQLQNPPPSIQQEQAKKLEAP